MTPKRPDSKRHFPKKTKVLLPLAEVPILLELRRPPHRLTYTQLAKKYEVSLVTIFNRIQEWHDLTPAQQKEVLRGNPITKKPQPAPTFPPSDWIQPPTREQLMGSGRSRLARTVERK